MLPTIKSDILSTRSQKTAIYVSCKEAPLLHPWFPQSLADFSLRPAAPQVCLAVICRQENRTGPKALCIHQCSYSTSSFLSFPRMKTMHALDISLTRISTRVQASWWQNVCWCGLGDQANQGGNDGHIHQWTFIGLNCSLTVQTSCINLHSSACVVGLARKGLVPVSRI